MAYGLFYVYTDPGTVPEAEFHDWYDHEHGPRRVKVPGFRGGYRYGALDEAKPPWLVLYDLDSPDVLDSPEYQALGATASERDKTVGAGLATLDRRIYTQLSSDGTAPDDARPGSACGGALCARGRRGRPAGLVRRRAHPDAARGARVAAHQEVPACPRDGRARLEFLSVHELAGPQVLEEPGYRAAISTPWRDRIVASALGRERRVFGFRNSLAAE